MLLSITHMQAIGHVLANCVIHISLDWQEAPWFNQTIRMYRFIKKFFILGYLSAYMIHSFIYKEEHIVTDCF